MSTVAEKVRKNWLRSWKAIFGYYIVNIFFFLVIGGIQDEGARDEASLSIFLSLWAMFWLYLCRVCAYKKPGTKLLTFFIWTALFGNIRNLNKLIKTDLDVYDIIEYAIFIAIFIWFFSSSLELRSLNKKLKNPSKSNNKQSKTTKSHDKENIMHQSCQR